MFDILKQDCENNNVNILQVVGCKYVLLKSYKNHFVYCFIAC
jgi:hypothetical protein